MGLIVFKTSLSKLAKLKSLRMNVAYYNPEEKANKLLRQLGKRFKLIPLKQIVSKVTQGSHVRLLDANSQGEIGIVSIENIDDRATQLLRPQSFLLESNVSVKKFLKEGSIITPRVRKIGNVGLVRTNSIYVASENVIVIQLSESKLIEHALMLEFVAYYLSLIGRYQLQLLRTGGKAGNINQWLVQETVIPLVPLDEQKKVLTKIREVNDHIERIQEEVTSLQQIIDDTFLKYGLKSTEPTTSLSVSFPTHFSKIGCQRYLRCGVRYRWFWDVNKGRLFEGTSNDFRLVKLGSLITPYDSKIVKKGELEREFCLIELDDLEPRTGRVSNEELVDKLGSHKILFGESDLLTTKLRPYLGYTILNDSTKPYIGTTELVPFKAKNKNIPSFIKYVLLSNDYLNKSQFLMYGKEHPRMHVDDILKIQVPDVSPSTQESVVNEIEKRELENNERHDHINELKSQAESLLLNVLGL